MYIVGDFNFSNINWSNINSITTGQCFINFKHFLDMFNLKQMINFSTHDHGSTLDLLITSTPCNIINVSQNEPFTSKCDHNTIEFKIHQTLAKSPPVRFKRNFFKCNYDKVNEFLQKANWQLVFKSNDINPLYTQFVSIIHQSVKKFVPLVKINNKPRLPKYIRNLQHLKLQLYKITKSDSTVKPLYKDLCNAYKYTVNNYYINKEQKVLSSSNKKSFFGYINKKLKSKHQLPPLLNNNGKILTDSIDKAEQLNNHFVSIFKQDNGNLPPISNLTFLDNITPMQNIVITAQQVKKTISLLKNSVSNTPDQIPSSFFKNTSSTLSQPICDLFNFSLKHGLVPDLWRQAIITPIHKKGPKNTAANYRPISLTSVLCRVLEHIIHDHLTAHLINNNLISDAQHGFVKKRSSLTQQLTFLDNLTYKYDKNLTCDVIYLDFSKAFDSVPHKKLLYILQHLKLNSSTLNWITHFLSNRTQQTIVDGSLSKSAGVVSGVPQGSVLGPLLFIIFLEILIRKLSEIEDVYVYVYADDIKLFSCNPINLQQSLNVVENWSSIWQLSIQPTKSEMITLRRNTQNNNLSSNNYTINNVTIPPVTIVKDLGLLITPDLKWHNYVSKICSKSISLVYLILKSFSSKNPLFFINLFKVYIRPNLEYNVSIWNPYHVGDVKKLESIQATFTRILCRKLNISYSSYKHRLMILNLESLEHRRLKIDLIYVYKIIHKLVDLEFNNFFQFSPIIKQYHLRRHTLHLISPKLPKTQVRFNFFTHRIINAWNKLPNEIVTSKTLTSFKLKLNRFDLNKIL